MADDDDNSGLIFFLCCCTVLPCTVLQGVGYFTPFWIVDDSCDTIGISRCCGHNETQECTPVIDNIYMASRLEAAAFSFFVISTLCSIVGICCSGNETCVGCSACIFVLLYGVAGSLSVSGCILIGMVYPSTSWGYSFYLCLVAGSYNCVQVICTCGLLCCSCCSGCKAEDEEERSQTTVGLDNIGGQTNTVATTNIVEDPIATTEHIDTAGDPTATLRGTDTNYVGTNFNEAQSIIPTISQTVDEKISTDA